MGANFGDIDMGVADEIDLHLRLLALPRSSSGSREMLWRWR